jgi:hypothetical protein
MPNGSCIPHQNPVSILIGGKGGEPQKTRVQIRREIASGAPTYAWISSVASLPTMCTIASRPPGCLGIQESSRRTTSSKMMMIWPSAMRPLISLGVITLSRAMVAMMRSGQQPGREEVLYRNRDTGGEDGEHEGVRRWRQPGRGIETMANGERKKKISS